MFFGTPGRRSLRGIVIFSRFAKQSDGGSKPLPYLVLLHKKIIGTVKHNEH